ncbi:MAG: cytochrome b [Cellvibrionaceae bacterium]
MKYHILLRATHWLMAICILGLIAIGWYMVGLIPEQGKYTFYDWHKTFGVLIILLFPLRVILRRYTSIPPLPEGIDKPTKKLSHIAHKVLYFLMITIPIVGYIYSSSGGYDVPFFGFIVPNVIGKSEWLFALSREVHWISAYLLLILVILHVAAVIKHRFFEGKENDVLNRML